MVYFSSILLVGAAGVGKTAFVKRHITGEFIKEYQPTTGATVETTSYQTNHGKVTLHFWEVPDTFSNSMRDKCYAGSDAAIIMYSVTSQQSYDAIEGYEASIRNICGDIPIVIVGTHCDELHRAVAPKDVTIHRVLDLPYFEISAKSSYNIEKPIMTMLQCATDDLDVTLREEPVTVASGSA